MPPATIRLGNRNENTGGPGGLQWNEPGDVVEVPYELALTLLRINGAGFYEVEDVVATEEVTKEAQEEERLRREQEEREANAQLRQNDHPLKEAISTTASRPRKAGGKSQAAIQKSLQQAPIKSPSLPAE